MASSSLESESLTPVNGLSRFYVKPVSVAMAVVIVGLCIAGGFFALFSNFRAYDDEGFLLIASQLFLAGEAFYTDIPWLYGPGSLAMVRVVHDWLGVPLSHSAVRFTTLVCWLLLCAVSSGLIYRLCSSLIWSAITFALVFIFTGSIVNEPGHPQGFIAVCTILIPLAACSLAAQRQKLPWLLIGALVAAVFNTKVNAGVYGAAAVFIALAANYPPILGRLVLSLVLMIGSILFPFVLMSALLAESYAPALACIIAATTGAVAVTAMTNRIPVLDARVGSMMFAIGFMAVTVAAIVFTAANGATVFDILANLQNYSRSQIEFYHFFSEYSGLQLLLAGLSLALALGFAVFPALSRGGWIEGLAKGGFVLMALYALLTNDPAHAQGMLGYAGPWCWLIALRREWYRFPVGRLLLATTAAWSPLLVYPMPGSQIYFGSLPILLAAIVCAEDILQTGRLRWLKIGRKRLAMAVQQLPALLCLIVIAALCWQLMELRGRYYRNQLLALPGTELIRIEPRRGEIYRELVQELNTVNVAVNTFRFNSLYLWSTVTMAGSIYQAHSLAFAQTEEQSRIKVDLLAASHPVVVTRPVMKGVQQPSSELMTWIGNNFEPYRKIGQYTLLKPVAGFPHRIENE
ncbi:MAG: hypothetical protein V7746_18230 [Halioglobus sp.]